MDITYDLLLDNLNSSFRVLCFGGECINTLSHPAIYKLGSEIRDNRVYLVTPDALPPLNMLNRSSLLLCVGGLPSLSYQHCGYPLMVIRDAPVWTVFSEILTIYERYEVWEQSLKDSSDSGSDIQDLLELTAPLLMNDLTVINDDLRIIAAVSFQYNKDGQPETICVTPNNTVMPASLLGKYRESFSSFRNRHRPFYSVDGCYCVNIFAEDRFLGNLSLYPRLKELRKSDSHIVDTLAKYVTGALYMQADVTGWIHSRFEQIVGKIYRNEFVSAEEMAEYTDPSGTGERRYYCIMTDCAERLPEGMSAEYIAETISGSSRDPVSIISGTRILFVKDFGSSGAENHDEYWSRLNELLSELGLTAGISTGFPNLSRLRFHSIQAEYAMMSFAGNADSIAARSASRIRRFRDIALDCLLHNCAGIFPAEYVCPPELLDFRLYDRGSDVDYWKTLRCYLDLQMNIAECARALDIHRNTMIQRIEKMQTILGRCLQEPSGRLWLRISIYLFDMEDAAE